MATITVNGSVFSILSGTSSLSKDKEDILCVVSSDDSTVVQIWETSPIESQRNLIYSAVYSDFTSPTGSTATMVVSEITDLLNANYDPASGTYTPTLTDIQNVASSTAYACQWLRVNDAVTVSGKVDIDATLSGASTRVGISLPVGTTLSAENQCAGTGSCPNVAFLVGAILGDTTNHRATFQYESSDTSNRSFYFTFTYLIA